VLAARDELAAECRRPPGVSELAGRLSWDEEAVVEALTAASTMVALPLLAPSDDDDEAGQERYGAVDPGYDWVECRLTIEDALQDLTDRERAVIRLRFSDELSFEEIAREMSLPRSQAAALLRRALVRLAAMANDASPRAVAA
jgi:RNA polymerase sigma-B factor